MPETYAALQTIASAAAGEAVSGAALAGAIGTVAQTAIVAYGLYQSVKAKRASGQEFPGQDMPFRGTDVPKWSAYGRCAPTPGLAYHCVHPANPNYYSAVFDVCHHEIDAFEDFLLNNESVGALGNGVWDGETYGVGHALAGTLVQPGSKWYKTWTESYAQTVTWPAEGGTVTLDYPTERYETVALESTDATNPGRVLEGNVNASGYGHWEGTQGGDEASRTLDVLTGDYEGRTVVITYRKKVGEPLLRIRKFLGVPAGERDTVLESDSGGEWSSTDVGAGVARFVMTFKWDMEVFGAIPFPDPKAVIRGKKVKTWSDDTVEWSQNGISCIADYLTDSTFGFGVDAGDVASALVIAGEAVCAETVASDDVGGLHARYTTDGVLFTNETLFDNLRRMIASVAGSAAYSGGQWLLRAGAYEIPALTLDDEQFARGPKEAAPFTSTRENFNAISGRFTDPALGYRPNAWEPYESSTYIAQDNGEKNFREIDLWMTTSAVRARRIAKQVLFRSRNSYTWAASYNMQAYPLQPGDGVYLKHKRRGWDTQNSGAGKSFFVAKRRLTSQGTVALTCVEDASAFYAWTYDEALEPDPAPNVSLPNPRYVAPLTGFAIESDSTTFRTLSDGSIIPYARVLWDLIAEAGRPLGGMIEILWKRAGDPAFRRHQVRLDEEQYLIEPVAPGDVLNATAYVKNSVGAQSEPVYAVHLVAGDSASGRIVSTNNRLRNASFDHNTGAWSTADVGIAAGTSQLLKPTADNGYPLSHIKGTPANALLRIPSTETGDGYAGVITSDEVSVVPGEQLAAYVSAIGWATDVFMQIEWLDSSGSSMGSVQSQTLSGVAVDTLTAQWSIEEHYTRLEISPMPVVPAGARTARMLIYGKGNWMPGPWKYVSVLKPMLGGVPVGVTALPIWSAGGMNSVNPILMPSGSAVQYTKIEFATAHSMIVPLALQSDFTLATIEAQVPGEAFITVQVELDTTYTGTLRAGIHDPNLKVFDGGTVIFSATSVPGQRTTTHTFVATIPVDRYQTVTPTLRLVHSLSATPTDIGTTRTAKIVGKFEIYRE